MPGEPSPNPAPQRSLTVLKITDAWDWIAEAENLLVMARELRARGHRVVIACARGTGLAERAPAEGFETHLVAGLHRRKNPLSFLAAAAGFRRLVASVRPDLVHAYRSPPHLMSIWATRGRGIPVVRTRATMVPPRASAVNRRIDAATAKTIVSAEAVKALCVQAGFDAERLVVIPGGIDLGRFDPARHDRAAAKRALGVPPEAPLVGQVARLAPIKGHAHLLRAAKEVLAAVPDARFALVGPALPGMREGLEGAARELGIAERVLFTGAVADVPAVLAAFDIGVVASVGSEAFSRATLEYLAMGLAVVATRVGTVPELVEDGRTGLLVPPSDAPALAAAIVALLRDEPRRHRLGEAARASAGRHQAHDQAERLEGVYREVLGA